MKWTKPLIDAFCQVRNIVMRSVGTSNYNPKLPLYLATDASDVAIGEMIYQVNDKKQVLPLGFFSKSLNKVEENHSAVDKELLALEGAVRHFHYLLEENQCTVYVDHKPLVNMMATKNCNLRFCKL